MVPILQNKMRVIASFIGRCGVFGHCLLQQLHLLSNQKVYVETLAVRFVLPSTGDFKAVVNTVGGLLASRRVFCWLPFVFFCS